MKNKGYMTGKNVEPCERCGGSRWKTKKKGEEWECRKCGRIRS